MFQLLDIFRFTLCPSSYFSLQYILFLPSFYFFVASAGSDTPISPVVMTLALSIVSSCLELSGARSAPQAAAAAGCLGSNSSKLVIQQDVSPVSCLIGAGNEGSDRVIHDG